MVPISLSPRASRISILHLVMFMHSCRKRSCFTRSLWRAEYRPRRLRGPCVRLLSNHALAGHQTAVKGDAVAAHDWGERPTQQLWTNCFDRRVVASRKTRMLVLVNETTGISWQQRTWPPVVRQYDRRDNWMCSESGHFRSPTTTPNMVQLTQSLSLRQLYKKVLICQAPDVGKYLIFR